MASVKEVRGPMPNGGVYSRAYYKDREGNPVDESKAFEVEIIEYNDQDQEIFRIYGLVNTDKNIG